MKTWLKNIRIPKSVLAIIVLAIGYYLNDETLRDAGWAILGIGIASKGIKAAQGADPFAHEKHLFNIPKKER